MRALVVMASSHPKPPHICAVQSLAVTLLHNQVFVDVTVNVGGGGGVMEKKVPLVRLVGGLRRAPKGGGEGWFVVVVSPLSHS